jgi:hypothetical protein
VGCTRSDVMNPSGRRILLLHEHHGLRHVLGRVCTRRAASLRLISSQSELVDLLVSGSEHADLVVAKDVAPDWCTTAAALIGCRAFGVTTPFILAGDPGDRWTTWAVDTAGAAILIDDRVVPWLVPLLVEDWLASVTQDHADVPDKARRLCIDGANVVARGVPGDDAAIGA